MKKGKVLVVGLILFLTGPGAHAWTVSESSIELPSTLEKELQLLESAPISKKMNVEPQSIMVKSEVASELNMEELKIEESTKELLNKNELIDEKNDAIVEDLGKGELIHKEEQPLKKSAVQPVQSMEQKQHKIKIQRNSGQEDTARKRAVFEKRPAKLENNEQAIIEYSQAQEYMNVGDDLKAVTFLERGLAKAPNQVLIRMELARLYLKLNRDLDAESLLESGLKLSPNHPELLKLSAVMFERRGEMDRALESLNKIPINKRSDIKTTAFLGHLLQLTGHYSKAREQYERLQRAEPRNPLWLLGIAVSFDAEGNKKEALENYEKLKLESMNSKMSDYAHKRILALKR